MVENSLKIKANRVKKTKQKNTKVIPANLTEGQNSSSNSPRIPSGLNDLFISNSTTFTSQEENNDSTQVELNYAVLQTALNNSLVNENFLECNAENLDFLRNEDNSISPPLRSPFFPTQQYGSILSTASLPVISQLTLTGI